MELRDSDDEGAGAGRSADVRRDALEPADRPVTELASDRSPAEFVSAVADLIEEDVETAADAIGELLAIARDEGGALHVAAGEALDAIGRRHPESFEVWTDALADAARDADDEVAFFALRAFAQLAAVNRRAAEKGRPAALENVGAPTPKLRQAALSVVAEVGPADPGAVRRVDRPLATALSDEHPVVRTAAAIAAGRLLGEEPSRFPRTANALLDAVSDEDEQVQRYAILALANYASEHPSNVPNKERAIAALAGASDDDLGLRRGATGEALSALVSLAFENDPTE